VVELEGTRAGPFFHCPQCQGRTRHLYLELGVVCRKCARLPTGERLDYASRHGEGRAAGVGAARIARLRKQIGAEPWPFAPLPPRPHQARWKHDQTVARIEAEETKLAVAFATLASDLERRLRTWRAQRRKGYSKRAAD
jgi:hypothetical protein